MAKKPIITECKIKMSKRRKEEVVWHVLFVIEGADFPLMMPVHLKNEVWTAGELQWKNDTGEWKPVNTKNNEHFKDHCFCQVLIAIKKHSKYRLQLQLLKKVVFSNRGFQPETYAACRVKIQEN